MRNVRAIGPMFVLAGAVGLAGCERSAAPNESAGAVGDAEPPAEVIEVADEARATPERVADGDADPPVGGDDAALREVLLATGREYESWRQATSNLLWAPFMCREVTHAVMSQSEDDDTHGGKLYHLFVRDLFDGYPRPAIGYGEPGTEPEGWTAPVGQTLVKQSWTTIEAPEWVPDETRTAIRDGVKFMTDKPAGLFVMHKSAPDTPGTDNGWTYAVLSPDGKEIQRMGMLEDCMSCHVSDAKYDRLFGQEAWEAE